MNYLFSHRNFPAQYRHILQELCKDKNNHILFLTNAAQSGNIKNIQKLVYSLKRNVPDNCHRYLQQYEKAVIHGQAAAELLIKLKNNGYKPDLICAHPWGNSMFFKDVYPNVPLLNYCEWYYNSENSDVDFDGHKPSYDEMAKIRCKNAQLLLDIVASDKAVAPTRWQKIQYPKEFHDKIEVLHDGIDTDYFKPNCDVLFSIPEKQLTLSQNDDVITYATRGMEEYRGFPEFMRMIETLLKKRKNTHVIIAGDDRVCYGRSIKGTTFKKKMLEELNLDLNRVHFVGSLIYPEYKKILQISSAHVYLTYPFVLSWSMLEAMSCCCYVIGSKTQPVQEVIKDNFNGKLVNFYDKEELLSAVEYALDNKNEIQKIKENARKTIIEQYDLKTLLPKHINLMNSLIG